MIPRWHTGRIAAATPSDFNFWRTAFSHGWCDLLPFTFDEKQRTIRRVLETEAGTLVDCTVRSAGPGIVINLRSPAPLTAATRRSVLTQMRTCLRLGEDFKPFHAAARRHPRFRWIARTCSGPMLRAPTMFEDIVKMICTTNCTWALTKIMVTNLVRIAGRSLHDSVAAFPDASSIASLTERRLRKEVKAGYRAPYVLELAERVASGKLDVEAWRTSRLPTEELLGELRTVKGVGPYAAENLLKLIGRYDRLGLDSWSRSRFYHLHSRGRRVKDATIWRHYEEYGEWRGLFFWLEMTRDWHDDKFPLSKEIS